ncbi:uncharacterized protein LOC120298424 isoform X2 [Crotalus tigris]|uniref:uncharacterized protein LOC120298424 isoform X2 n=1 Tax=Crotalus tigris TaxID=88082 RepID=UPI00192F75AC|nr:uncharacterized protein LOC120298424 isoform X2 [Crotalus tigris]
MAVRRFFRNIWKRCSALFCCTKSDVEDLPEPPDRIDEGQKRHDQKGEWQTHLCVSDGHRSSSQGVLMGVRATARIPRKEEVAPVLISMRNENMAKWRPRLLTISETCTESDPLEECQPRDDVQEESSACLSREKKQEHWRPRLPPILETCVESDEEDQPAEEELSPTEEKTQTSEDSMEVQVGSGINSLEDFDSISALLDEVSEGSWEQAAEALEASLSSSPWVRKTKCFLLGKDRVPLFSSPNLSELCWRALGSGAR